MKIRKTLNFSFRTNELALSMIITQTAEAIYSSLWGKYLNLPCASEDWAEISKHFENMEFSKSHYMGNISGFNVQGWVAPCIATTRDFAFGGMQYKALFYTFWLKAGGCQQ